MLGRIIEVGHPGQAALRVIRQPMALDSIRAPLADKNLRRALLLFDNNGFAFFAKQYVGHVLVLTMVAVFLEGITRGVRTRMRKAPPVAETRT